MKEKIKKFWEENKVKIIAVGSGTIAIVGGALWIKSKNVSALETAEKITSHLPNLVKNDLPVPKWDGVEVFNHWFEDDYIRNMILSCPAYKMGELGDKLIDLGANPDISIEMVLSYFEG